MKVSFAILALLGLTESTKLIKGVRFFEEDSFIQLDPDQKTKQIPVKALLAKSKTFGYKEYDALLAVLQENTAPEENLYENLIRSM